MASQKIIKTSRSEDYYIAQMIAEANCNTNVFCDKCNDTGYELIIDDDENCLASICACKKTVMWHQAFANAGVYREFYDMTLASTWNINQDAYGNDLGSNREQKRIVGEFMEKYINAIPAFAAGIKLVIVNSNKPKTKINSVKLVGGVGSGKTLLASIAVQETLKKGLKAKMFSWSDLETNLSDYEKREEQDMIANDFAYCDLIVIDNVQTRQFNPCFVQQLDRMCQERVRSDRATIITMSEEQGIFNLGQHWQGLLAKCYKVPLPSYCATNNNKNMKDKELDVKTRKTTAQITSE